MAEPTEDIHPRRVLQYIPDVDYPAGKAALIESAERHNAPEWVLKALRALPPVDYRSREEVVQSVRVDPDKALPPHRQAELARDKRHQRIAEHMRVPPE
jgi:hypothetical protein